MFIFNKVNLMIIFIKKNLMIIFNKENLMTLLFAIPILFTFLFATITMCWSSIDEIKMSKRIDYIRKRAELVSWDMTINLAIDSARVHMDSVYNIFDGLRNGTCDSAGIASLQSKLNKHKNAIDSCRIKMAFQRTPLAQ
jgi:hypothetical protein